MTTYAIGDLQGCYQPFCRLLDQINFDPTSDKLWLVGDLVNRGPDSLSTLRLVRSLGNAAISVLGNHDIHLLALHYGLRPVKEKDADLLKILEAKDGDALIDWIRQLPLLYVNTESNSLLVHAGIYPQWTLEQAQSLASELQQQLSSDTNGSTLTTIYGNTSGNWQAEKDGPERLKFALNCFTRMRFLALDGTLDFDHAGPPGSQPQPLQPWFEQPTSVSQHILFGHWASLGLHQRGKIHALDSGCVWGNQLSAVSVPDFQIYAVDCG